jgi:hypothetical protein
MRIGRICFGMCFSHLTLANITTLVMIESSIRLKNTRNRCLMRQSPNIQIGFRVSSERQAALRCSVVCLPLFVGTTSPKEFLARLIPAGRLSFILRGFCCSEGCRSGGDLIGGSKMQVGGAERISRSRGSPHPPGGQRLSNAAGRPQILLEWRHKCSLPTRTNRALDALLLSSIFDIWMIGYVACVGNREEKLLGYDARASNPTYECYF